MRAKLYMVTAVKIYMFGQEIVSNNLEFKNYLFGVTNMVKSGH